VKSDLNLASEAWKFPNKIYLKSETHVGSANEWPSFSPNLLQVTHPNSDKWGWNSHSEKRSGKIDWIL